LRLSIGSNRYAVAPRVPTFSWRVRPTVSRASRVTLRFTIRLPSCSSWMLSVTASAV